MARRKSGKKGRVTRHVKHAGVMGGLAGFAAKILLDPKTEMHGSTASAVHWLVGEPNMAIPERISRASNVITQNLKDLDSYYPLIGGALITAAPRIPFVRMVAAPVNTQIRNMTKGRWGL